jgi:hypothetical protein
VEKLRARLAYHRQFARAEEPPERIPGNLPVVYGEEENRLYGAEVRKRMQELGVIESDRKRNRKNKQRERRARQANRAELR